MAEISYPIYTGDKVKDAMTVAKWKNVTKAIGDGILAGGGSPYWLRSLNDVDNTALLTVSTTTGTAEAVMNGFYHSLDADLKITIPAVAAATTYTVGLCFDPTKVATDAGPITAEVWAGSPDTTSGKRYMPFWEVARKPSQVLSQAVVTEKRIKVGGWIVVSREDQLPDPTTVLWGTQALVTTTNQHWRASSNNESTPNAWYCISDPGWTNFDPSKSSAYKSAGPGYKPGYRIIGNRVELRGIVARSNDALFSAAASNGYAVAWDAPAPDPSAPGQRFITAVSGTGSPGFATISFGPDGQLEGRTGRAWVSKNCSWISLDGISYVLK